VSAAYSLTSRSQRPLACELAGVDAASSAFNYRLWCKALNAIDALRRIFIANGYRRLHGCRAECSLQLFHVVVLNQNDAWRRRRPLKRYSLTPTGKEFTANLLVHFRNGREEFFGEPVLIIDSDFHDLEGRREHTRFELLRLQAPRRQQAFPILRSQFDSSWAPEVKEEIGNALKAAWIHDLG